jgi:hypothetical protein
MMDPCLRASPRHGGQGVVQSLIRRGSVPFWCGGIYHTGSKDGNDSKIASDKNKMIFIGKLSLFK